MAKQKKSGSAVVTREVVTVLAAWLGSWIPISMVLLSVGYPIPWTWLIVLALLTVMFRVLEPQSKRVRILVKIGILAVSGLVIFLMRETCMNAFFEIRDDVIRAVNEYYDKDFFITGNVADEENAVFFLLLLPGILYLIYSDMAARGKLWMAWLILSLPAPFFSVFTDVFPPVWIVCVYVGLAVYFAMTEGHATESEEDYDFRQSRRYRVTTALLLCGMLLASCAVMSEDFYDNNVKDMDLRRSAMKKLIQTFPKFFGGGTGQAEEYSGMSNGRLPRQGNMNTSSESALIVRVQSGIKTLYLKGASYGYYTGSSWEAENSHPFLVQTISRLADDSLILGRLPASFGKKYIDGGISGRYARFEVYRTYMRIQITGANPTYVYAPYDTYDITNEKKQSLLYDPELTSFSVDEDGNLLSRITLNEESWFLATFVDSEHTYWCDYIYNDARMPVYAAYAEDIEASRSGGYPEPVNDSMEFTLSEYTRYVHENYTKIPEYLDFIPGLAAKVGLVNDAQQTQLSTDVKKVRSYLASACTYTLTPGATPNNKDFIQYFLTEGKQGFCFHFASAGVMLFRAMGIPARFCEGYLLNDNATEIPEEASPQDYSATLRYTDGKGYTTKTEYKTYDIPQSNAHAWVEIYIDNYGWFPVEVTPGYIDQTDVDRTLQTLERKREIGATPTPTPATTITPTPKNEKPTNAPNGDPKKPTASKPAEQKSFTLSKTLKWVIAILIIVIAALFIPRFVASRSRSRLIRQRNTTAAVKYLCRDMGRVMRLRGLPPQDGETDADYVARAQELFGHATEFRETLAIGNRAAFSGEKITKEEYKTVRTLYRELRSDALAERNIFGKIWIWLIRLV